MGRLPEDYRAILRLRYDDGLSFDDIAARMGRTPEAARKLWARAVARLQQEMDEHPMTPDPARDESYADLLAACDEAIGAGVASAPAPDGFGRAGAGRWTACTGCNRRKAGRTRPARSARSAGSTSGGSWAAAGSGWCTWRSTRGWAATWP